MTRESAVRVGKIVRPHGLRGEVVVRESPLTAEELLQVKTLQLHAMDGTRREIRVHATRPFGDAILAQFERISDVGEARTLRGGQLFAERNVMPALGEDEIYHIDLIGLDVVEESGRPLGRVEKVLVTGAHEVLEVRDGERTLLIPYHKEVVLGWDPDAARITVRLPPGLEEIYG